VCECPTGPVINAELGRDVIEQITSRTKYDDRGTPLAISKTLLGDPSQIIVISILCGHGKVPASSRPFRRRSLP